ncbi:hypothetical protein ABZW11_01325 [Nonomuraea sp. NPDC004580]|uniref:hypothetical protein n=1 Tax=Nonomuraea sp. NPDC004580 TaxID=3154552 RepID=UPI0033A413B5
MFRHLRRRARRGDQQFYFKPSLRRRWRKPPPEDFPPGPLFDPHEKLWRVAWWGEGWGVWPGDADPLTTPPTYSTRNIPRADYTAAGYWACGVVPYHPKLHVSCSHQGDPSARPRLRSG